MNKYIDAERLKAKIERRKLQNRYIDTDGYEQELFEIIDSLQQEQQGEPGVDVTDFCKPIDPGIAQCVADHWWEMLGDKEPDKSLDEEIQRYLREKCSDDDEPTVSEIARHFAEWGAEHAKK